MIESRRNAGSLGRRPLAAAFAAAGVLVMALLFDQRLLKAISSTHSPLMQEVTSVVSELRGIASGVGIGLIVLAVGYALGRDRLRRAGVLILLSVLVSGTTVALLKPAIGRYGPAGPLQSSTRAAGIHLPWGRFPSGHAAAAFSTASALSNAYPATAPFGYGLGLLVVYERTYRGIHYPSDCFAGALIGFLSTALVARWLRSRPGWRRPDPHL